MTTDAATRGTTDVATRGHSGDTGREQRCIVDRTLRRSAKRGMNARVPHHQNGVGALGASADMRFCCSRAERGNRSGGAPWAVLGGSSSVQAQLVQRTRHPRPPPQHTPGPRATRRRAPKPQHV